MVGIKLKDFQYNCVDELMRNVIFGDKVQTIIDAPTGSGKTIILLEFIDEFLKEHPNTVFIWLTPGQGELEEQSQDKMIKYLPGRNSKNVQDVLINGFENGDTVFINWEKVTKKGSIALKEAERKNLKERIIEAKNSGITFLVIVDEEHRNDTDKANAIINEIDPQRIIRVSATPKGKNIANIIKIPEIDVINSGLITRAIYINEDIDNNSKIDNEVEFLVDLALKKRNQIRETCIKRNVVYNPLVIIQFPSMFEKLIKRVEDYLNKNDITYENGSLAKWMSDKKENIENIRENMSPVKFLLFKQAINTGWDCPRAKILIKLRENMNEPFEIQTLGRIRRMPEGKHYNEILLDNCYLYTFDEKYKKEVKASYSDSSEVKLLTLKKEFYDFKMIKEYKDNEANRFGNRESAKVIYQFFVDKYKLNKKKSENKTILENNSFTFNPDIISKVAKGKQIEIENMELERIDIRTTVNTHSHGLDLRHSIGVISSKAGMRYEIGRQILERLFMLNPRNLFQKILTLSKKEFYAFVINNEEKLKDDFREAVSQNNEQLNLQINTMREEEFKFPTIDTIRYDADAKLQNFYNKNIYNGYLSSAKHSTCEGLFESYCEKSDFVKWWYKNGESSQQYFSLIYADTLNKTWSFYPDFIIKDINNDIWIIETKGGEDRSGNSKNIDMKVASKYTALCRYALKHNIKYGFIREIGTDLFITQAKDYIEDMHDSSWQSLENVFKK